ncbi:substrate-binding domain-containing protein [Bacillaceae bacterium W0354]
MPFVLKKYLDNHSEVEVDLNVMDSTRIEEAVLSEKVDIGLTLIESREEALSQQVLYEDQIVFAAPHDGYDLETAPASDPEQLFRQYYVLTHNHPHYWNSLLHQLNNRFSNIRTMKVSQNYITKRFIISGLGVSFLPKSTIRRELLEGRMIEVDLPDFSLPKVKTYALMKYHHEREKRFLQFVEKYHFQ